MFQISIKKAFSFSDNYLKETCARDQGSNGDEIHTLKLEIYREKVNLNTILSIPDPIYSVSLDI